MARFLKKKDIEGTKRQEGHEINNSSYPDIGIS